MEPPPVKVSQPVEEDSMFGDASRLSPPIAEATPNGVRLASAIWRGFRVRGAKPF